MWGILPLAGRTRSTPNKNCALLYTEKRSGVKSAQRKIIEIGNSSGRPALQVDIYMFSWAYLLAVELNIYAVVCHFDSARTISYNRLCLPTNTQNMCSCHVYRAQQNSRHCIYYSTNYIADPAWILQLDWCAVQQKPAKHLDRIRPDAAQQHTVAMGKHSTRIYLLERRDIYRYNICMQQWNNNIMNHTWRRDRRAMNFDTERNNMSLIQRMLYLSGLVECIHRVV
jgi:hypothetical protein